MSKKTALNPNSESGFTLVELLVVILIIGILSAIAIPAYMNQRTEAANATLKSDLKNISLSYQTWASASKSPNKDFSQLSSTISAPIYGKNAKFGSESTTPWNDIETGAPSRVSEGTYISMVIVSEGKESPTWRREHQDGEFCLAGNHIGSDYDFVSNSGMGGANYHRTLYYDSALGGIQTAQQIADAMNDGRVASCDGQISVWLTRNGSNANDYWAEYETIND